ncbi:MAG: universal stress protein [Acidaminococcaceae bacterium]
MEDFHKILVPFDGSEHAEKALARAVYFAKLCGSEILILNVVDLNKKISSFEQVSTGGYVPSDFKEEGYRIMLNFADNIPKEIKTKYMVEIGRPAEIILDICKQESCDLIIMGSRGLSTLKQLILGSVSDYVMSNAMCPVMVIR